MEGVKVIDGRRHLINEHISSIDLHINNDIACLHMPPHLFSLLPWYKAIKCVAIPLFLSNHSCMMHRSQSEIDGAPASTAN
jgi:hypothetical protein